MKLLQINLEKELKQQINDKDKENQKQKVLDYYRLFGLNQFLKENNYLLTNIEEDVLIVNLDCDVEELRIFIEQQKYKKMKIKNINDVTKTDINNSRYIGFIEKNHVYHEWKVMDMVLHLITSKEDISICYRDMMTDMEIVVKDVSYIYWRELQEVSISGKQLLKVCISNGINLYGSLSTVMCESKLFLPEFSQEYNFITPTTIGKTKLLYNLLIRGNVRYLNRVYVLKRVDEYNQKRDINIKNQYNKCCLEWMQKEGVIENNRRSFENIKREITFFYTDSSEYFNLEPIAKQAKTKGYQVKFTKNIKEKAEIGIYCQHIPCPENSKLSIILLHDMAQGHDRWPNIWIRENWDKFDIGILPGVEWRNRWALCASASYVRPKRGVYELGYPKGDMAFSDEIVQKSEMVRNNFKYNFTVLYAPSWENDGKEDDFVSALIDLPINLLIKQVPVADSEQFDFVRENIRLMREMHDGQYDNLFYIEPDENIMVALAACDMVVSDESSVMTEASIYGKPSLAITDWLIPDQLPSRYACVPTQNVMKCAKSEMRQVIENIIKDKTKYKAACAMGKNFFSNQGQCCDDIVELIDCLIADKQIPKHIAEKEVFCKYEKISLWN